ncbi:tetratricopeptide repeat protein [Rhodopirellula europaea]|uniref:Putative membrane protein n=1 Tax=Rhodopirellula europaea SH398 TaxID=1263868 RepID=M5S143_9BACT|nr:tetratricopeptide repeat protein [Rhodopirellula europaea]EMI25313.1 putative membrane protein [Rhodopirellula europaea SH398]
METVSIQAKHYWTCLWPGMSELWWRGRLSALPTAVAFAAVVNALLIAKFIYPGWLSGALVALACWIAVAAWVVLTVRSFRELPLLLAPRQVSDQPDRFAEAQLAYLTGNYALAEEALTAGLSIEPRDPPALLLLAAVLRHTGRLNAADALLTEIPKLEAAAAWNLEWESERARLERDLDSRGELQDNAESEHEPPENAEETNASPSPAASAEEPETETTEPIPTAVAEDSDNGEANTDDAEESEPATLSIDTALRSFSSGEDDDLDDERPHSGYSEAA